MNLCLQRVDNGNKKGNKPGHYYSKTLPFKKVHSLFLLSSLSLLILFYQGQCTWSRLSNPYSGTSRARCTIGGLGNLTPIISTALRSPSAPHAFPLFFCQGQCTWSWLSNPYSGASKARCTIGGPGNLTPIISTALRSPSAPHAFSLFFCQGQCTWSRLSNPYSGASKARCTIGGPGNLTSIISTALLSPSAPHAFSLSSCQGQCTWSRLSNPYSGASKARCIIVAL